MAIGTPTGIGTNTTAGPSTNVSTTGTVPSGALVIMVVGTGINSGTSVITASGGGLTWATDVSNLFSGVIPWYLSVFSAQAPSGLAASSTLTASCTGSFIANMVAVVYCTGLDTSSPKDISDGNGASATNWDTTATTTTVADTLVIGGCIHDGLTSNTATGGATELQDFQYATDAWTMATEYKILAATASTSLTGTWLAGANNYSAAFVAYKAAAAGGGGGGALSPRTFNAIPFMTGVL